MDGKIDNILEKLQTHEKRINIHGDRLDDLEKNEARISVKMEHLIEKIDSLITTVKWAGGIVITTFIGFFIWYVQQLGR